MPHAGDVVQDSEPQRERRRRRDDIIDDQSDTVLQLSRFAYKTTPFSPRAPDSGPSRPVSRVRKDLQDRLLDSQLAQLSKCISCGLEWTSRKTATQKRLHITQCAKKNALTKDTLRILAEKETAVSSPSQNIQRSRVDLNETTLMDSVLSTSSVKKCKRQQVLATVKSLPETRSSILDRARDILGPANDYANPQPTQQFGQSVLAHRNPQHSKCPTLHDVDRFMEEPPRTQTFEASSLRAGTITEQQVDSCEGSSFLHFGAALFAQDPISSGDQHKRTSPPLRQVVTPGT